MEAADLIDSAREILVVPIVLHEYMLVTIRKLRVHNQLRCSQD